MMKSGMAVCLLLGVGALVLDAVLSGGGNRRLVLNGRPVPKTPQAPKLPPRGSPQPYDLVDPWSDGLPPPKRLAKPGPWRLETGPKITADYHRQYAAVIQLSGMQASFGSDEDVYKELRKMHPFEALTVWGEAKDVPAGGPWTSLEDESGRFWASGFPSRLPGGKLKTFPRDKRIHMLWSREVFAHED